MANGLLSPKRAPALAPPAPPLQASKIRLYVANPSRVARIAILTISRKPSRPTRQLACLYPFRNAPSPSLPSFWYALAPRTRSPAHPLTHPEAHQHIPNPSCPSRIRHSEPKAKNPCIFQATNLRGNPLTLPASPAEAQPPARHFPPPASGSHRLREPLGPGLLHPPPPTQRTSHHHALSPEPAPLPSLPR